MQKPLNSEYYLLAGTTEYYKLNNNQTGSAMLLFDVRKNLT